MKDICLYIRRTPRLFHEGIYDGYKALYLQDIWDTVFEIPYLDFRNHLADIAMSGFIKLKVACIFNHHDFDLKLFEKIKYDSRYVILPVDDDDWIDPSLIPILRELDYKDYQCVTWNTIRFSHLFNTISTISDHNFHLIPSCGYAVTDAVESIVRDHNPTMNHLIMTECVRDGIYKAHHISQTHAWLNNIVSSMHLVMTYPDLQFKPVEEVKKFMVACASHAFKYNRHREGIPEWARPQWIELVKLMNKLEVKK